MKGGCPMSNHTYLKFLTEEFIKYLNIPKEERRRNKEAGKHDKTAPLNRWFGLLPFSLRLFIKGK